jgi:hypothetical protein
MTTDRSSLRDHTVAPSSIEISASRLSRLTFRLTRIIAASDPPPAASASLDLCLVHDRQVGYEAVDVCSMLAICQLYRLDVSWTNNCPMIPPGIFSAIHITAWPPAGCSDRHPDRWLNFWIHRSIPGREVPQTGVAYTDILMIRKELGIIATIGVSH